MPHFDDICEVSPAGDLLVRAARQHPFRDAVVFPDRRRNYGDLLSDAERCARGMLALGVRPGDHIGLLASNSLEFVAAFFGILMLGCVAVPLNARHKEREIGYIVRNANLTLLFSTSDPADHVDFGALISGAIPALRAATCARRLNLPEAPALRHVVMLRGAGAGALLPRADFDALADRIAPDAVHQARRRVRLCATALILYTSGTTADPKGCMLSHEAISRGPVERARHRFQTDPHAVHWGGGPLFHIGTLAPMLGTIGVAGTFLTDTSFVPGRALELIERERASTAWPWFPAIMQALVDHPGRSPAALGSLRTVMLIGPPKLIERVGALLPDAEIVQGCGMTETAGVFALSDPDESPRARAHTQGKAVPGIDVRIVDIDTGEEAAEGEVGEILVRGYCVMSGYYNDPAKTAEAIDADGWLHTGDLYRRSASGSLSFNGRIKDMLKVGGENVAAIEIEAYLCGHPAVRLAEVVGRPDARLDEVPVAFVELRPGARAEEDELIAFCHGKIASYKVPRAVFFMRGEDWPMSATKVNKRALRQRLADTAVAG
ncbi:class I adenylate-forming enzyme family protein [Pseudoduganella namucuonensis]|uniref:Fatty-acyl-CoA synthase/long-chain acyl-CoA synthetase n=1 Tax=Pseudoduganella namucuonensis TaxID=1035707 RepID=A0A1I7KZ51_9BURK|nr:class I adenylate-forming enzyme family protein [Pseudoduganella namucuonensis]SFV02730.1 fatty-acyl-CoA synthase/long-chain acyl-CoA synthetase [Pseudoduganella namucuonensis]